MPPNKDDLSIYDVLMILVEMQTWQDETKHRRMVQAINNARESRLFSTEGMMKL